MPDRRTRVIRFTFESPPDPDRFHPKERCRFAVVVLFPKEVEPPGHTPWTLREQ